MSDDLGFSMAGRLYGCMALMWLAGLSAIGLFVWKVLL